MARREVPVEGSLVAAGGREPLSAHAVVAISVAIGVGISSGLFVLAGEGRSWLPPVGPPAQGGSSSADCTLTPSLPCPLAAAGTRWTMGPVSEWCSRVGSALPLSNNTSPGTGWSCQPSPVLFTFAISRSSVLSGAVAVSGSFQVWVVPAGGLCALEAQLTGVALPCPAPVPLVPAYSWNSTHSGGSLDLSTLGFDFGSGAGVFPPLSWAVEIVDVQSFAEPVSVYAPVAVAPR